MTIFAFILALGVLIFVHELGHFLAAKRLGIGVEKFSLGFGPRLIGFRRGETTYLLSLLPLGGYVKLRGEEADTTTRGDPRSFAERPVGHRLWVVFTGPFMNIVLAFLLMPLVFLLGREEPAYWEEPPVVAQVQKATPASEIGLVPGDRILSIDRKKVAHWRDVSREVVLNAGEKLSLTFERSGEETTREVTVGGEELRGGFLGVEPILHIGNEAIVDEVLPEGAAAEAGIREGDTVVGIEGEPIENWTEMAERLQKSQGAPTTLELLRGEKTISLSVKPRFDDGTGRWVMGIQKDLEKRGIPLVVKRYSFGEAVALGLEENWKLGQLTLGVVWRLVTFRLSYKTLGGPIRIAQVSAVAARTGFSHFLYFIAFLSLQLGVLNFIPIPILDGGHILFMGIEGICRRPLPMRARQVAEQAGFVLLITLMVLVTLHDVDSIWGFERLFEKVRGLF